MVTFGTIEPIHSNVAFCADGCSLSFSVVSFGEEAKHLCSQRPIYIDSDANIRDDDQVEWLLSLLFRVITNATYLETCVELVSALITLNHHDDA